MAKLHRIICAISILFLLSIPSLALAADFLDPSGFGSVKFGMTTKQAERALGAKLKLTSDEDPTGRCLRGSRADGVDPGVAYMAVKGVIQRVDVELSHAPSIRTPEGVGSGATPEVVRQIYGARAERDHTDYAGDDDIVVNGSDHRGGIQFRFEGGKLTWMTAGNYPALSFSEGCL